MRNITVDDAASTKELVYTPPLCDGNGWTVLTDRGHGGSYRRCDAPGAKATFTFTGVGVYYLCPRITGGQSVRLTLDGVALEPVSLSVGPANSADRSATGSQESHVVWSRVGLQQGPHTLEVLPGPNSTRVRVDAFIYTVLGQEELAAQAASSSIASSRSSSASSVISSEPEAVKNRAVIIVGSIVGFIILAIFIAISYKLWKQAKERSSRYGWKSPVPPLYQSGNFSTTNDVGATKSYIPSQSRSNSRPMPDDMSHQTISPHTQHTIEISAQQKAMSHNDLSMEAGYDEISDTQHNLHRNNASPSPSWQQPSGPQSRPTYPPPAIKPTLKLQPLRRSPQ